MAEMISKWSLPMVCLPVGDSDESTLMQDWTVVSCGWRITVPRGTRTDGASIPRALWRLCGHPLESPRVYAALVHDFLYGGGGPIEVTRADADGVYRDLLVRLGWGRVRAWIEWSALRCCGSSHWTDRKTKGEQT